MSALGERQTGENRKERRKEQENRTTRRKRRRGREIWRGKKAEDEVLKKKSQLTLTIRNKENAKKQPNERAGLRTRAHVSKALGLDHRRLDMIEKKSVRQ